MYEGTLSRQKTTCLLPIRALYRVFQSSVTLFGFFSLRRKGQGGSRPRSLGGVKDGTTGQLAVPWRPRASAGRTRCRLAEPPEIRCLTHSTYLGVSVVPSKVKRHVVSLERPRFRLPVTCFVFRNPHSHQPITSDTHPPVTKTKQSRETTDPQRQSRATGAGSRDRTCPGRPPR